MIAQSGAGVRIEFDVPAVMRDGTVLRANIYRPDDGGAGTYPVLLTRLPYGKDLPLGSSILNPEQAARRGYIVVVQDVRGSYTSEGDWFPFIHEGADGVDTAAWAAGLAGSNGRVGMYGASYYGFTQWAAVRDGAPAVRAMVPMITWADPDDGQVTRDGVIELGVLGSWTMQVGIDKLIRRHRGDPQALGRAIYALTREFDALPARGYRELPLSQFGPLARLGLVEPVTASVVGRGNQAFTAPARVTDAYARVDIPMLHVGGWYDIFLQGTITNFLGMQAHATAPQRLVIGPWTHGRFEGLVGDVDFGLASSGALLDLRTDLYSLQLQFFDAYLKESSNGFDTWPAVKYFVMGLNTWKSSETWPPANTHEQHWYLHSQGRANALSGDGLLAIEYPTTQPADQYGYDPAEPVPTIGGATLMHPVFRAGPRDQRPVEERADVLVYTSAPLDQSVEVTGQVRAVLYVATDAPDTDFVARLVDVYPDGSALPLCDGIIRLGYRRGVSVAAPPLVPNEPLRVEIDLWATSNCFLPGHRIRLDITSSNFPRWERNLNTGRSAGETTEMRPARQTVLHDAEHPSFVILPVVAAE